MLLGCMWSCIVSKKSTWVYEPLMDVACVVAIGLIWINDQVEVLQKYGSGPWGWHVKGFHMHKGEILDHLCNTKELMQLVICCSSLLILQRMQEAQSLRKDWLRKLLNLIIMMICRWQVACKVIQICNSQSSYQVLKVEAQVVRVHPQALLLKQ